MFVWVRLSTAVSEKNLLWLTETTSAQYLFHQLCLSKSNRKPCLQHWLDIAAWLGNRTSTKSYLICSMPLKILWFYTYVLKPKTIKEANIWLDTWHTASRWLLTVCKLMGRTLIFTYEGQSGLVTWKVSSLSCLQFFVYIFPSCYFLSCYFLSSSNHGLRKLSWDKSTCLVFTIPLEPFYNISE